MLAALSAVFLLHVLAKGDEACNAHGKDGVDIIGSALLQRSHQKTAVWGAGLDVDSQGGRMLPSFALSLAQSGRRTLSDSYQGAPHCVSHDATEAQGKKQASLTTRSAKVFARRTIGGADASLDAAGFRSTTSLCCPVEMEVFFGRLLDSRGYEYCSKPHVQGLMHWFTCVPDMDLQYMLDIIENGNPCKYWGAKGQACPTLSTMCAGRWCSGTGNSESIVGPTTVPPATEAPATAAPATEAPATEAPEIKVLPTEAPAREAPEAPEIKVLPTEAPAPEAPEAPEIKVLPTETPTAKKPTTGTPTTEAPTTPAPTTVPTTTTKATTTTIVAGCAGVPKDIMMVIDASKSVKQPGWDAEADFAKRLIQEVMADGNPSQHQLNVQWFNADTKPIGASGGANSQGRFSTSPQPLVGALTSLGYVGIRAGSTDHPQVYLTSDVAFQSPSSGAKPGNEKVLVMITDGETHKGNKCKKLTRGKAEAKIGACDSSHVCSPRGCDVEKCMCGLYNAALFKEKGYKLVVVGIANQNHIGETDAGIFNNIIKQTATPGDAYIANNFEDLKALVVPLVKSLCQ